MSALPRLDRTAVMIIDLQNGFCHPQGSFAGLGLDVGNLTSALPGASDSRRSPERRDSP